LGVGLLVLQAGTFLVPGLGLGGALLAILVGTLLGNLLLALAGVIGSDNSIPSMVMLRPVLGIRGSYLPSFANVIQLLGWSAFELWIMARAADSILISLFGISGYWPWLVALTVWCTLLALGGPLVVIRQWLERFGIWLVYASTAWITGYLLLNYDVLGLLGQAGEGGLPFLLAVDIVIAMPVSWMPLVADYNRFARNSRGAFWGTYLGYALANVWFYSLGAILILVLQTDDLVGAITAMGMGWLALAIILVDETDNAFADIYSTAVSGQNILSKVPQRVLILGAGIVSLVLAVLVSTMEAHQVYEGFLLTIGSVFVPLFGVLFADYFLVSRRNYVSGELYRSGGQYWYWHGVHLPGLVAWVLGILAFNLINRLLPWVGASIPSLVIALGLYWILARLNLRSAAETSPGEGGRP
jgi:NCS1 family nucleobase:cation symporter-1